ncbi:hypothetical protein Ct9H90mP29_13820 [bacterium]|nr:MAG: hypothetical protein Ct9H90mP29_13820 [bacterium]
MSRMGLYTTRLKPPYRLGMEIAGVVSKSGSEKNRSLVGRRSLVSVGRGLF